MLSRPQTLLQKREHEAQSEGGSGTREVISKQSEYRHVDNV
jgi:hypothetical protein